MCIKLVNETGLHSGTLDGSTVGCARTKVIGSRGFMFYVRVTVHR
jgi:hypothetical protein